jgi:DNA-binding winged helix-turn-helix (wHTH) protein
MRDVEAAGTALVLEMATGTAIVHGEQIELPLKEFKLLAELAQRVGETVEASALIAAAWPEAPWTTAQDLYVLVSKLRRLIDGPNNFGQNIRNRRGFGYRLDLNADQVVVTQSAPVPGETVEHLGHPEEPADTPDISDYVSSEPRDDPVTAPVPLTGSAASPDLVTPCRGFRLGASVALAAALLGLSWAGGFFLSRHFSSPSKSPAQPQVLAPSDRPSAKPGPRRSTNRESKESGKKPRNGGQQKETVKGSSVSSVAFIAPGSGTESTKPTPGPSSADSTGPKRSKPGPTDTTEPTSPSEGPKKETRKDQAPPQLPPAPTRYLYHLVNQRTGDHFVTTDGNAASEYETKGYEGGAIGRTYTYQEDGTRAVTTDAGTAYVFISSAPKTEPASRTLALWYSTDDNGDFFYTTSESEAKQSGWTGSLIGYVRSL